MSQPWSPIRAVGWVGLRAAVATIFLPVLWAHAQQTKAKIDALPHFPVSGHVANGKDGTPIAGAAVSLSWIERSCTPYIPQPGSTRPVPDCAMPAQYTPEFASVLTDKAGSFFFQAVPEGRYNVRAQARDYVNASSIQRTPDDSLGNFYLDGNTRDIELRLLPTASLHGFVLDEHGRPLANWPVNLFGTQVYGQGFTATFFANQAVKSGADGSFAFDSVDPGDYFLTTERQPAPPAADGQPRIFPAAHWPSSKPGLPVPRTVHLDPDGSVTATIHVSPKPLHHVTGYVTNVPSDPAQAIQLGVAAIPEYGGEWYSQSAPLEHGRIEFLLPDGHYKILAWTNTNHAEALATVAGSDLSGVSIQWRPRVEVPVHITARASTASAPMPGNSLLQQASFGFAILFAADSSDGQSFGMGTSESESAPPPDEEGRTHLAPRAPGRYKIVTVDGPSWYVASITSYDHDLAVEPYPITDEAHASPIEVQLRDDGGSVSGVVHQQGRPAAAFIYALPLFPSTSELRTFVCHDDGIYHLQALAPGNYRILALGHEIAIPFREDISSWLTRGRYITVNRKSDAHLDLFLDP